MSCSVFYQLAFFLILIRTLKLQLNELNEIFTSIQSDLRTRSQACELVQTCLEELNLFLDALQFDSKDNEILSQTVIRNLHVSSQDLPFLVVFCFLVESIRSIRSERQTFTNSRFIFKSMYNRINASI